MSGARRKLEQRRSRVLPSLLALLANQSPREVVHECCRHVPECGQIDIAQTEKFSFYFSGPISVFPSNQTLDQGRVATTTSCQNRGCYPVSRYG
jgi:hypothetical protein